MPNRNSNTNSSRIEGFNKILILLDKQKVEEEVDKKKWQRKCKWNFITTQSKFRWHYVKQEVEN